MRWNSVGIVNSIKLSYLVVERITLLSAFLFLVENENE